MHLKNLSDQELLSQTQSLASEERKLTARLLDHLSEVRSRGLHLERGYGSLFQFCMEALGFTESQAQSRISAMKLSQELPEVVQQVAEGKISLTNAAAAQVFFRNEKKAGKSYSIDAKRELVSQLEGLSTRQCERRLAEVSPQSAPQERERPLSDGQTELRIIVDVELMRDLQKLKDLWAHSLPERTYAELLKKMTKLALEKVDPAKKSMKARAPHSPETGAPQFQQTSQVGLSEVDQLPEVHPSHLEEPPEPPLGLRFKQSRSRYIPRSVWLTVWKRDQGLCTYVDPQTGKSCVSQHGLQVDHIKPFAQGGDHTLQNLRLRCRAHNLLAAEQVYGRKRMGGHGMG